MDEDLFASRWDYDILTNAPMECDPSEDIQPMEEEDVNKTPEFDCLGEDSVRKNDFSKKTFIRNQFSRNYGSINIQSLTFSSFPCITLDMMNIDSVADFVFNQCRINVQALLASLSNPIKIDISNSFYHLRKEVTTTMHLMRSENASVQRIFEDRMRSFQTFLNRIFTERLIKMFFMASHSRGNEMEIPAYHVLHGFLEWKVIDLQVIEVQEMSEKGFISTDEGSTFLVQSKKFLKDLAYISLLYFNKNSEMNLDRISPFPCGCVKECWLVLLTLFYKKNLNFWAHFNEAVSTFEKELNKHSMTEASFSIYKVWVLKSLVLLQNLKASNLELDFEFTGTFIEDVEFLKETTDKFCKIESTENQCKSFLMLLMPTVICWWSPKTDIPMILWEFFHKKLNTNFDVPVGMMLKIEKSSHSGKYCLEKVQERLFISDDDLLNQDQDFFSRKSSFYLFTMIIGKTIQRFARSNETHQINKMLGRVLVKFSAPKLIALTEGGLHNLIELFLTFSVASGQVDILMKLKDKLLLINMSHLTVTRQIAVTKGHIAFMVLSCQQQINISEYATKLLEQISQIKANENQYIVRLLAGGLIDVIHEDLSLHLGQAGLIDSWLTDYLQLSTSDEQDLMFEVLHNLFARIKDQPEMMEIQNTLEIHLLPFIKQKFATSFSMWIPILAADLCLCRHSTDKVLTEKNIKFFIDLNCSSKEYLIKFLASLLSSHKDSIVSSTMIIKIWLRSLVTLPATHVDVSKMTNIVADLEEFKMVCGGFETDLFTSKEPLHVFVSAVWKHYSSLTQFQKKREVSDKFNLYLSSFDRWILEKNEKLEVLQRFYSFLAIVIYNCAEIVYEKARNTCFFHIAITKFILPQSIQMGKAPELSLKHIVHKIWPFVVQGIARLNFKCDSYVLKTLNDLIQKWTPLFKFTSNTKIIAKPFITMMNGENTDVVLYVLEKLTSMFLTAQRRQSDPNACLVVTIFQEIVSAYSEDSFKMERFLKGTCFASFEHLMMVDDIVPSKKMIFQLYEKVTKTTSFRENENIREMIQEHLKNLIVKHLAYNTNFLFEMLEGFVKVNKSLVENVMDFLLEQIVIVEGKRGGGLDRRIRSCLEKLKVALRK